MQKLGGEMQAGMTMTHFTVRTGATLQEGECVVLVGDQPPLGAWEVSQGVVMHQVEDGKWQCELALETSLYYLYKYVRAKLIKDEDHLLVELIEWEPFDPNRSVKTEGLAMYIDDRSYGIHYNAISEARIKVYHGYVFGGLDPPRATPPARELQTSDGIIKAPAQNLIIVLYRLPIVAKRNESGRWSFGWDDDALYLTSLGLRNALDPKIRVTWVGIINADEDVLESEKDMVAQELFNKFRCVPVFLSRETLTRFYNGFCKGVLWPLLHSANTMFDDNGRTELFDKQLWLLYKTVNRVFCSTVVSLYQDGNLVWVHDYHLMVLPALLRKDLAGVKIGFYLHTPWPSSEIYRAFPFRDDILTGLLSSTVLGFHLFDYARHFISACVRLLNLEHETRRGSIGVDYMGRHVTIRVSHIGIDPVRFSERLESSEVVREMSEFREKYPNRRFIGGVDDLDIFKGIALKLRAFERLLHKYPEYRGNLSLLQVAIPKKRIEPPAFTRELEEIVMRINDKFSEKDYQPVLYWEKQISLDSRVALYKNFDALLLTPIRDGLNLIPYEYVLSTETGKSHMVLSEFTGCSRALSSAVRLNPWNVDDIVSAVRKALEEDDSIHNLKHTADEKLIKEHSTASWAESFLADLERGREPVTKGKKLGMGLALSYGLLDFDGFERLEVENVAISYRLSSRRLILLDYDGTLVSGPCSTKASSGSKPSDSVINYLRKMGEDEKNTVFILSGRSQKALDDTFEGMDNIGLAAEHGLYYKFPRSSRWQQMETEDTLVWMEVARDIMEQYEDKTDGAYIEQKTAGLAWHFADADREFGEWQAKELHDHLETMLSAFNIQVVVGNGTLQVRLASVNKGNMVQQIVAANEEDPDFVLCIGDDRTDEDMFTFLARRFDIPKGVFSCTVGVKPSDAQYYLGSPEEVHELLASLAVRRTLSVASKIGTSLRDLVPSQTFSDFTEVDY